MFADQAERDQYNLERDVSWCVAQLEVKLGRLTDRNSTSRAQDVSKVMRTLTNPSVPSTKKRVLMRNNFGDYRKKIQEDERKHLEGRKFMKLFRYQPYL